MRELLISRILELAKNNSVYTMDDPSTRKLTPIAREYLTGKTDFDLVDFLDKLIFEIVKDNTKTICNAKI